jgi:3-hydroxybutyryl-CoA dehydrogenase
MWKQNAISLEKWEKKRPPKQSLPATVPPSPYREWRRAAAGQSLPLQGVNLADLMGGTKTLPEVMDKCDEWIRSIGHVPLRVNKETLGFCFNNVWRAIKKQTLYMWANGFVDFRDIDRAWRILWGTKLAPFGLMDTVGLDTVYNIEMVYYNESKDPRDKPPDELMEKIKKGELGVKTGKGFYTYPDPEYLRPDFLNP